LSVYFLVGIGIKLFEMYRDEGITGFVDDEYGFIDEPIYKGALSLLDRLR